MFPPTKIVPFCAFAKLQIAKAAITRIFFMIWVFILILAFH
jgi:hypothetical protein